MADDAATPDGALSTVTTRARTAPTASVARSTDTDTRPSSQIRDDEMTTSTTEQAANQHEAESRTVDRTAEDDHRVADDEDTEPEASANTRSPARLAVIFGLVAVVGLAALAGWLGARTYQSDHVSQQRNMFLQVGRQGAINLTTIDWQHADADIQRILDSATGTFYDDFSTRSQPFVDVVKQGQATSVGTVTEAGLESATGNEAQVLVAVTVKTSNAGAADQAPRAWRMRISVQKIGEEAKVSNVEFVP
jgi:Mce-associated membrane protein